MSTDTISSRLRAITDDARCRGCGATRKECQRLFAESNDPIGCCDPHDHTISAAAVAALTREVESGTVAPPKEPTPRKEPGMSWFDYLNQGQVWRPNGKPPVAIADMDQEWRYNAARWLERGAVAIGQRYSLDSSLWLAVQLGSPLGPSENAADRIERDIERENAEIDRDPVAWIRTTPLHQALMTGLPTKPKKLAALAERARHWSTCPARTGDGDCRCEQIQQDNAGRAHLSECPVASGVTGADCRCGDTSPEWTI